MKTSNLFSPRRIGLVGATERAVWTHVLASAFAGYGFDGELFAINREGREVRGIPGFASCADVPGGVDAGYVMVPVHAVEAAITDLIAAGARMAVILTSGFAEVGPEGVALQERLVQLAKEGGLTIFGPNSLGFANIAERRPLTTLQPRLPIIDGRVAIVSQSGATANELLDVAHRHHVGLSFIAATGNEAMVGLPDLIDYLVEQDRTAVIGVYLETIRDAERLRQSALNAASRGKPLVILKVGSAPLTASIAAAHTGALVGDDRVFDAVCERFAIVRAKTVEELVLTCGFLADNPEATSRRIGVVSTSGGACAMIADHAAEAGVDLPALTAETIERLTAVLPAYATPMNPLDVTGAATADVELFARSVEIVGQDPSIDAVYTVFPVPATEADARLNPFPAIGRGMAAAQVPGGAWTQSLQPVTAFGVQILRDAGVPFVLNGIEHGLRSIRNASVWHERRERLAHRAPASSDTAKSVSARLSTERAALDYLAAQGVPVIPARLVRSRDEAAQAASAPGSYVLKIASPDIQHKTDIGGVELNVVGAGAAAAAYDRIVANAERLVPKARIDGIIVSPMRNAGLELIVGVARDPFWGPVLAVGLGGVLVEVLSDSVLSLLPVTPDEVRLMLARLKGQALLQGVRGSPPADLDRLADTIAAIGDAALALGDELAALEINPLLIRGDHIEALDALALYKDAS